MSPHSSLARGILHQASFAPKQPNVPSAPLSPEPQGHCERSRLATCSLPVSLVEETIRRLRKGAEIAIDCGCPLSAELLIGTANDLRAEMERATERQPAENTKLSDAKRSL